jgi:hypothetical protein
MKGNRDLRVPSEQGRENYGQIKRPCGCPLGSRCEHVMKRCYRSKFNPITCTWKCNCKAEGKECI